MASTRKLDRKHHEPGWGEVILGAVLSVVLGAALGVVALVFKPVTVVKEKDMPSEPAPGVTYFIEGSRDTGKAKQANAKRKAFAQGASGQFSIIEDELNTIAGPATPVAPPPKKAGDKPAAGAPAAGSAVPAGETLAAGTPNFRIADNAVQIGIPVTMNLLGADLRVIMQARGNFVKKGNVFAYEPTSLMVGGCPMDRLPFAAGYVTKKFLDSQVIAEDIAATWPKVVDVKVDGRTLKVTLP